MSSVPERPSIIGKIEYEPDARRVVDGLILALTYQPDERRCIEAVKVVLQRAAERQSRAAAERQSRAAAEQEPAAPTAPKQRKARPKPSRLAKWEASWQADEAQS